MNSHLYQVKTIGEELGIGFLGVGFDPKWQIEQIPIMPKDRYEQQYITQTTHHMNKLQQHMIAGSCSNVLPAWCHAISLGLWYMFAFVGLHTVA